MAAKKNGFHQVLRVALRVIAGLIAAAVLYLAVILVESDTKKEAPAASLPLPDTVGTVTVSDSANLDGLYNAFGAPALRLRSNQYTLQTAQCRDIGYGSGYARVLQIAYQAEEGSVCLVSIRPAAALSLLTPSGMTLSTDMKQALAGMSAVLFTDDAGSRRLYAQGQDAAYLLYSEDVLPETFQSFCSHVTLTSQEDIP